MLNSSGRLKIQECIHYPPNAQFCSRGKYSENQSTTLIGGVVTAPSVPIHTCEIHVGYGTYNHH